MSDSTTRDRILDEAERLFADQGFDATSLRAITTAAGANLAAVNYHFGSKEQLLREAVRRRVLPVNAERIRRLDAAIARAGGGTPPLREIIDAFVRPAVEAFSGFDPHRFMGMVRILHSSELAEGDFFAELFGPVVRRFAIVADAVPGVPGAEIACRFHFMVGSMIQAFASHTPSVHPALRSLDPNTVADFLVTWAEAGFRAAATPPSTSTTAPAVVPNPEESPA